MGPLMKGDGSGRLPDIVQLQEKHDDALHANASARVRVGAIFERVQKNRTKQAARNGYHHRHLSTESVKSSDA